MKKLKKFPVIKIDGSGSPGEAGHTYGKEAREAIECNLDYFDLSGKREALSDYAQQTIDYLRRAFPALLEELRGIAEGSGVAVKDIVMLNQRSPEGPGIGCTPMAISQSSDGPILAKNNDGLPGERPAFVVRRVAVDERFPILQITYAGWISGLDAVNSAGLGLAHASVGSVFPKPNPGLDIRLRAYDLLGRCSTTKEFREQLREVPLSGKGFNLVVADRTGSTCVIEAPVPRLAQRNTGAPFVYATNHYNLSEFANADQRTEAGKTTSRQRYAFLEDLQQTGPPQSVQDIQRLLSSHGAGPCRHGGEQSSHTLWSMIAILHQNRLMVSEGPPCSTDYTMYTLDESTGS